MSGGISAWDVAEDSPHLCIRCGARVAVWESLGGPMESVMIHKRCRRCRNDQTPTADRSTENDEGS